MKKLICTFTAILFLSACFGQRYEVWVGAGSTKNKVKGNYGFSNDSILMIYSNPSLLFPSKDKHFSWDDVNDLSIRNKSKNQFGQILGASAGCLALFMVNNSVKKSSNNEGLGIYMVVAIPAFIGTGALIGHLATKKKTVIPVQGLNPRDKNQMIESKIKKRTKSN